MLTPAQKATLLSFINATPEALSFYQIGDLQGLADYMNAAASPAFTVWRTKVPQDEITQNGFDWLRVDNLTVGKARIWEWMFANEARAINPSKANVRAGIEEAWKGTAADLAVRAAVFSHCKRAASRVEKLFATGIGSDADPAVMSYEGKLVYQDFIDL